MVSQCFRVEIPIIAIVLVNGLHTTLYTNAGDEVIVEHGPLNGVALVEVKWKERTALMFTIELREHAELISELPVRPTDTSHAAVACGHAK